MENHTAKSATESYSSLLVLSVRETSLETTSLQWRKYGTLIASSVTDVGKFWLPIISSRRKESLIVKMTSMTFSRQSALRARNLLKMYVKKPFTLSITLGVISSLKNA